MIFTPTEIEGAYLIDIEPIVDERGFFARACCQNEFQQRGLVAHWPQSNIAWSQRRGTLRGLHFVAPPHEEAKLVRCTHGAAYVAVADLRAESPTHRHWIAVELTADNHRSLYVPPRCAQGYQTLVGGTEMYYQMSVEYIPDATRGLRYDDPLFGIRWPLALTSISPADRSWPDYSFNVPMGTKSLSGAAS